MSDIEVLEGPPSRNLTTLEKVKQYLRITTVDAARDAVLEDMIAAASQFAMTYTGRDFARQTVIERLPGKGTAELVLAITPIVNLIAVEYDGSDISDAEILDREAGFIQRPSGFRSTAYSHPSIDGHPSSSYRYLWAVTYEGGYILPGWGTSQGTRNLPPDLERACLEMVKSTYLSQGVDGNWKSYKIGDTSVTWAQTSSDVASMSTAGVPPTALNVLNWYRRPF